MDHNQESGGRKPCGISLDQIDSIGIKLNTSERSCLRKKPIWGTENQAICLCS